LPGFYCKNKGHIPSYVPFTNVNDGICDYELCCDGSEEWEGVGGVKCADKCDEIGKEWRKHDEARQKSASNAAKKRAELVREAARLRQTIEDRLQSLGTEIEGGELKVKQLEQELAETKKKETGKLVQPAGSKGGKLGVLVGLAQKRTEELRSSLIATRAELSAGRSRLQNLEAIMTTFKEEYNPNFNDEGVKRAVRAWEDYVASSGGATQPNDAQERDLDEIAKDDSEVGLIWEDYTEEDDSSETDVLYAFENYLPPTVRTWLDSKLRDLRLILIENGILADTSSKDGESKKVTDARARLTAAEKDLVNLRTTLSTSQTDLATDFGPDDVFRALKSTCISTDSGEYTYELCHLDKTSQKSKKGGGSTNMGKYTGLEKIVVDEDLPVDGKGLGSGERWAMKFENGQHCWNGPNRRTTVVLACSETDEIWKIFEEEKCVYRMEVGTPAVCEAKAQKVEQGKDEL
jgi:protein kinase C substrate 80K-H